MSFLSDKKLANKYINDDLRVPVRLKTSDIVARVVEDDDMNYAVTRGLDLCQLYPAKTEGGLIESQIQTVLGDLLVYKYLWPESYRQKLDFRHLYNLQRADCLKQGISERIEDILFVPLEIVSSSSTLGFNAETAVDPDKGNLLSVTDAEIRDDWNYLSVVLCGDKYEKHCGFLLGFATSEELKTQGAIHPLDDSPDKKYFQNSCVLQVRQLQPITKIKKIIYEKLKPLQEDIQKIRSSVEANPKNYGYFQKKKTKRLRDLEALILKQITQSGVIDEKVEKEFLTIVEKGIEEKLKKIKGKALTSKE